MRPALPAATAILLALAAGCTQPPPASAPGGSSNQITLQPVSVEGSVGLNAAAGVAAVSLRKMP